MTTDTTNTERLALKTIAELPMQEQDNTLSASMREIARAALAEAESLDAARARVAEAELNCAEEVLDDYAVGLTLEQTSFDCIGDYIKAVVDSTRAEAEGQAVDAPDERQRWLDACSRVIHGDDGPSEDWNPSVAWEQAVMLVRSIALAAAPEAPAAQETKP